MSLQRPVGRRFLFSVSGGYGHFHPLVPLARALEQAGHEVAFVWSAGMRAVVEASGFAFFPIGSLQADPEYQQIKAQMSTMPPSLDTELFVYTRLFCGVSTRLRVPNLIHLAQSWHADMLIREAGEYGASIAAEYLALPHASVAFAASLTGMAVFEHDAAAQLDPIRQSWGLTPDPALQALYRYLHLAYSPPSFSTQALDGQDAAGAIPDTTHYIRTEFFDQSGAEQLPDWVAKLPPQPVVYVTMGTEVNKDPALYPSVLQTMIAGLRDAPVNLIITIGRENDPADFGPQPANVHIERYIPQSLLLPYCDLLIMHGGSNSLLAAIDVGLPMVAVPFLGDQFFNAQALQKLQLGQVVPLAQLTPASVRTAMDAVLANPLYRQHTQRVQAEMHALPDQQYAVGLVEKVVAAT